MNELDRILFTKVLANWAREGAQDGPATRRVESYMERFPRCDLMWLEKTMGLHPNQVDLYKERAWISGPRVKRGTPVLFPLATFTIAADEITRWRICLRVGLFFEHQDEVRVHGWRFESAETPTQFADGTMSHPPHPYPHAQPILTWTHGVDLASPEARDIAGNSDLPPLNEQRPAFPLRGSTAVGLAVSMLATLHGAPWTRALLGGHPVLQSMPAELREDVDAVLRPAYDARRT